MNRIKAIQLRTSGSVLALALFIMAILMLTGAGLLSIGYESRVYAMRTADFIVARSAADSGMTKAIWELNSRLGAGWTDDDLPHEWHVGLPSFEAPDSANYSYWIGKASFFQKLDEAGLLPGEIHDILKYILDTNPGTKDYLIMSIGRYRQARKRIFATVQIRRRGGDGVIVKDMCILKSGTFVGGYNSLDPSDNEQYTEIGTLSIENDRVILNNGVVVDGNVLVGVGGDVEKVIKDLGGETTGDRYALQEEIILEPVVAPPMNDDWPAIDIKGEILQLSSSDSGRYPSITLKNSTEPTILEIAGEVTLHVTGDIWLGQGCEIKIADEASLDLYIDGDFLSGEESGINNLGSPLGLHIWGTGEPTTNPAKRQTLQLNAKSDFFGEVYAPDADITMMAKGDLYGAFTANSFEMKAGGNLYYDEALGEVAPNDEGTKFVLRRWSE